MNTTTTTNHKPNFQMPNTERCIVRFVNKKGVIEEVTMNTPANSPALINTMLMEHKVGYSQIRAVKACHDSKITDLRGVNLAGLLPQKFTRREPMFI